MARDSVGRMLSLYPGLENILLKSSRSRSRSKCRRVSPSLSILAPFALILIEYRMELEKLPTTVAFINMVFEASVTLNDWDVVDDNCSWNVSSKPLIFYIQVYCEKLWLTDRFKTYPVHFSHFSLSFPDKSANRIASSTRDTPFDQ